MLPRLLPLYLAAAFLSAGPTTAQSAPADPPVKTPSQTIVLQHVMPGELLKSLHWDTAAALPVGVTQITAVPATNALAVVATSDGFAQVQEIIALVDVAPRQLKIEYVLTGLTAAQIKASGISFERIPVAGVVGRQPGEMKYASGTKVTEFLRTLQARKLSLASSTVTTTSNGETSLNLSSFPSSLPNLATFNFAFTPRVGDDGIDTLALRPLATWRIPQQLNASGTPATQTEGLTSERSVRDGETLVFINLFVGAAGTGKQLALFVRPTALPAK